MRCLLDIEQEVEYLSLELKKGVWDGDTNFGMVSTQMRFIALRPPKKLSSGTLLRSLGEKKGLTKETGRRDWDEGEQGEWGAPKANVQISSGKECSNVKSCC